MEQRGHELRVIGGPVRIEAVTAMRLSGLVVDLSVLGARSWEWLESLCGAAPNLGVIVCTGPSTVAQRVRGLRLGADDWVSKPTHPEEVIARLEAVVRRRRRTSEKRGAAPVAAGEVEILPDRFQAFVCGRSLDLTRREFELLELLARAEGRVLEREDIYSRLWGYAMVRGDRSVDVFVRKLRLKLEKASPGWRYIHTHFGIGYRFAAEQESSEESIDHRPPSDADEWSETTRDHGIVAEPSSRRLEADEPRDQIVGRSELRPRGAGEQFELARPQQHDELAASTV